MCILANPFFENVYSFDFKEEYTSGGGSQARGSGPLRRALLPEEPDRSRLFSTLHISTSIMLSSISL